MIPERFIERYGKICGDEKAFIDSLETILPRTLRINTIKASAKEVLERFKGYGIKLESVPWYSDAFTIGGPGAGKTLEHFMGHIYMQELTSMMPPLLVKKEIQGNVVLDACAAPGSKTTQLSALMANSGTVVANDISYGRIKALKFNMEKMGAINTVMLNQNLNLFPNIQFNVILLDAPCSSEGTSRKNPAIMQRWRERNIRKQSVIQKQLIIKAFDLLSPGGVMIYSTCTYAPEENEAILDHLLENRPAKLEPISVPNLKLAPGITEWEGTKFREDVKKAARVWPHMNDTGGFFLGRVRK